jgi:hypothetical protein
MITFIMDFGWCVLYILGFFKDEADLAEEDAKYCKRELL